MGPVLLTRSTSGSVSTGVDVGRIAARGAAPVRVAAGVPATGSLTKRPSERQGLDGHRK